jgi:carbon-monoxide dehydrogenase small subunit
MKVTLTINGEKIACEAPADEKLLDTLRRLGFTGAKKGCGEGTCGSCVVLIDGRPANSCLVFTASVEGRTVTTIEGLGDPAHPHPIEEEFVKAGAVQCGFCTPGMVLSAKALLDVNPSPTEEQIKAALDGNLCRCTGYVKIIEAVRNAAVRAAAQPGK